MKFTKPLIGHGFLVCLLSFGVILGCAMNPVTGRPDLVLTTTEGEREIGANEAKKVEQQIGLTDDPRLAAYVESLGQRLATHSPRQDIPYKFYVVEMVEPNAFALPGGFVYVSRGLLPIVNSEDELAGVVGHEIGHVAARHSVQRLSAAAPFAIVGGVTGAVTGIVSDNLSDAVMGITGFTGSIFLAPYSRSQEREADDVGVDLAAAGGYDPDGLSRFLHALEVQEKLRTEKPKTPSFFDSHPSTPERVRNTADYAKTVTRGPARPIAADHEAFIKKLDGVVIGTHPAEGVFNENLFLHPHLDFALRFPAGYETQISRQMVLAGDKEQLTLAFLQVAAEGNDPMDVPRELDKKSGGKVLDKIERFQVGGLPAARLVFQAKTKHGVMGVDLNWIAYQGVIYQIAGLSPEKKFKTFEPIFRQTVNSFRPLTRTERSNFTITRLRLARARQGESLQSFISRTDCVWTDEQVAAANGIQTNTVLKDGQLLKITKRERYMPR
jgi:predicted Zn-dependent protease